VRVNGRGKGDAEGKASSWKRGIEESKRRRRKTPKSKVTKVVLKNPEKRKERGGEGPQVKTHTSGEQR